MEGALELTRKSCSSCMTPMEKVQCLAQDQLLNEEVMDWMIESGRSRFPVRSADGSSKLLGVLLMKRLIKLRPEDATPISEQKLNPLHHVSEDTRLYDLLDIFQVGKSHMAAVYSREYEDHLNKDDSPPEGAVALGVVTLEDLIEELIMEEIYDETESGASLKRSDTGTASSPLTGRRMRARSSAGKLLEGGRTPRRSDKSRSQSQ